MEPLQKIAIRAQYINHAIGNSYHLELARAQPIARFKRLRTRCTRNRWIK